MTNSFQFQQFFSELLCHEFRFKKSAGIITDSSDQFINLKIHKNYLAEWNNDGTEELSQIMTIMVSRSFLWSLCLRFKKIDFDLFQTFLVQHLRQVLNIEGPISIVLMEKNAFQMNLKVNPKDVFTKVWEYQTLNFGPFNIVQAKHELETEDEFKARYFDLNETPHHLEFREIMRTTGVLNKETNTFSFGRRCSFSWGSSKGRIFRGAESEPIEILNLRINSYEFAHQRIINPPLFYSSAIVRFLDELNIRDRSPINIIQS